MTTPVERRALESTFIGGLSFLVTFGQTILLVPILLQFWGAERYGFWLSLSAVYGLLQTINTGHQNYIGNELCKFYTTNTIRIKKILASGIAVDSLLSLFSFISLLGIIAFGYLGSFLGVAQPLIIKHKLGLGIVILVGTWLINGSISGILGRLYAPSGLLSRSLWWGIITRLSQTLGVAFTAILGGDVLAACVISSIAITLVNMLLFWDISRNFYKLYPFWSGGDWKTGWLNLSKSIVLTSSIILLQLQNNGLILRVTAVLGAAAVPVFTTIRTLSNTLLQATTIITQPLIPEMTRYHAQGGHEKLASTISASWWIGSILINLSLVVTLPLVEPVYLHWTQEKIGFDWVLYLLLAWQTSIKNFGSPLVSYLVGINHLRAQGEMAIAQTTIVLGGAILFIAQYGLVAVGFAVVLGELVASVLIPTKFAAQELQRLGGKFPSFQMVLALSSVALVGLVFLGVGIGWLTPTIWAVVGGLGLLPLYAAQWTQLPSEVKIRFWNLFTGLYRCLG
jgi:O-antigen/teichoic acid export membrane protein